MRQRLKIALVVLLVAANAGLLFLLKEKMAESRADAAKVSPSVAPATSATPTPEPTREAGGEQSLAVARDDAIFRIYGGACSGKDVAGITVSTDSGATFDEIGLPGRHAGGLHVDGGGFPTHSISSPPTRVASHSGSFPLMGGRGWEAAEGADVWFLDEKNRVTAPVGVVDPGCDETLTLSVPNRKTARVFCATGVLIGTTTAGRTWNRLGSLDGIRAAAYVDGRRAFALAPDGGCVTGTYSTNDAGRTWTAAGCLDAAPGRAGPPTTTWWPRSPATPSTSARTMAAPGASSGRQ